MLRRRRRTPGLAVVRAYERMLTGDVPGARQWARQAIEVGSTCDPAACAIGRVAEARLLILDGDVQQGLALLDEAGVATVSGELDALSTGVVYCELVCALQGLALYDVAEQWTEAMERWCETNAIGSLHGRCRVHRAEILRLRGSCDEAQRQALMACEELRPYLRRELGWPLNELGRIRLHQGDIAGAEEALLAAHRAGWDPQPGLALVRLAQGDVAAAAASIRDALEHPLRVPSKERPPNTDLQRAPLLEAQVEIAIAAGDIDRARSAADELELIADRFESKALVAGAAHARGRVRLADGDAAGAERSLSDAVRLWNEVGAPYETALARLDLADAHHASGSEQRADLERQAARTMLEAIEAAPSGPSADSDALHERPVASANVFRREGDYWMVNFDESHRPRARPQGHALPRPAPGRPGTGVPRAGSRRRRDQQRCATQQQPGEPPAAARHSATPGRCSTLEPKTPTADASPRSTTTSNRRTTIGDGERAAQADAERDFLLRELSRAVGLSGRDRRAASASERARAGVTRAVRQAITRIAEHHPQLGEHLNRTIRTGTYCAYMPDPRAPAGWRT